MRARTLKLHRGSCVHVRVREEARSDAGRLAENCYRIPQGKRWGAGRCGFAMGRSRVISEVELPKVADGFASGE